MPIHSTVSGTIGIKVTGASLVPGKAHKGTMDGVGRSHLGGIYLEIVSWEKSKPGKIFFPSKAK